MSNSLKGGKSGDVTTVVTSVVGSYSATSHSKNDPCGSVMTSSPWSLRLNDYQKDIIDEAAKRMGKSKQAYLRHAALEYALTQLKIS